MLIRKARAEEYPDVRLFYHSLIDAMQGKCDRGRFSVTKKCDREPSPVSLPLAEFFSRRYNGVGNEVF